MLSLWIIRRVNWVISQVVALTFTHFQIKLIIQNKEISNGMHIVGISNEHMWMTTSAVTAFCSCGSALCYLFSPLFHVSCLPKHAWRGGKPGTEHLALCLVWYHWLVGGSGTSSCTPLISVLCCMLGKSRPTCCSSSLPGSWETSLLMFPSCFTAVLPGTAPLLVIRCYIKGALWSFPPPLRAPDK